MCTVLNSDLKCDSEPQEPLPAPGQSLALQVRNKANQLESYKFNRPADSDRYLDSLNFDAVLAHISPNNILSLFASMVIERRVLFMSKNVTLLSEVIQALLGLLYPCSWQVRFLKHRTFCLCARVFDN
jgi:hypothetical protein